MQVFSEEAGATAVEYALMIALIAIIIFTAVTLIGTNLQSMFNKFIFEMGW